MTTQKQQKKEHISSVHFRAAKSTSERHNLRNQKLNYVHTDLTKNNQSFVSEKIKKVRDKAIAYCKEKTKRKPRKDTQWIKEGVVNIKSTTTMEDLHRLADAYNQKLGISIFQIHIHRDEGLVLDDKSIRINNHAHLVGLFQNQETGKSLRLNPKQLSLMQDITAEVLEMKRGQLRVNTGTKRLEVTPFQIEQEKKKLLANVKLTPQEVTEIKKERKWELAQEVELSKWDLEVAKLQKKEKINLTADEVKEKKDNLKSAISLTLDETTEVKTELKKEIVLTEDEKETAKNDRWQEFFRHLDEQFRKEQAKSQEELDKLLESVKRAEINKAKVDLSIEELQVDENGLKENVELLKAETESLAFNNKLRMELLKGFNKFNPDIAKKRIEKEICINPVLSLEYATEILGKRFELGEKAITSNSKTRDPYNKFLKGLQGVEKKTPTRKL